MSATAHTEQPPAITREVLEQDGLRAYFARHHPDVEVLDDATLRASRDRMLADAPDSVDPDTGVFVFAYGSLIWNPCVPVAEHRPARLYGYHRDFRLRMTHGRGSPEAPGLMLALTGGGSCRGVALRLPPENLRAELLLIWRREMLTGVYVPRWVAVATPGERVWALAFVANTRSERYIARPDEATAAAYLSTGRGALGTCAAYLDKTVQDLRAWGLYDRRLERLHQRVFTHTAPAACPQGVARQGAKPGSAAQALGSNVL